MNKIEQDICIGLLKKMERLIQEDAIEKWSSCEEAPKKSTDKGIVRDLDSPHTISITLILKD